MAVSSSTAICRLAVLLAAVLIFCSMCVQLTFGADDELHQLGLDHLDIIGTRFVDEHHNIHDYPESSDSSDKGHKIHGSSDESDDKDYHNPIYDHVDAHKDDYSNFGGHKSSDSEDSHDKYDDKSDDKSHS